MKRIAPFNIRKHLYESPVLSKLDYCSSVSDPLTIIQQRRLKKIQNSCAALVFNQLLSVRCTFIGVATYERTYCDENCQLILSSPTQQKLFRILKIKFCTKKTFVTSMK